MASNQELRQASVRGVTGTTYDYNGDWSALFTARGIAAGDWNGRLLGYINAKLVSAYTNLPQAQAAFAANVGVANWDSIGTFTP